MTWRLHDLKDPKPIDVSYDFTDHIAQIPDIIEIGPTKVTGELHLADDELRAHLHIEVTPILACAKTLKAVSYPMSFDVDMIFGDGPDADFTLDDPFDLKEVVFGCVISEKPYVIYHPDARDVHFDKEKAPHPAFADLDKASKT